MKNLTVYIDGASKGNPGRASIGVAIYSGTGKLLKQYSDSVGTTTNNVAEYMALITALIKCAKFQAESILIKSDSQLLVKQMLGQYRVKDEWLQRLHFIASKLVEEFPKVGFKHIPREENSKADSLANFKEISPADSKLF